VLNTSWIRSRADLTLEILSVIEAFEANPVLVACRYFPEIFPDCMLDPRFKFVIGKHQANFDSYKHPKRPPLPQPKSIVHTYKVSYQCKFPDGLATLNMWELELVHGSATVVSLDGRLIYSVVSEQVTKEEVVKPTLDRNGTRVLEFLDALFRVNGGIAAFTVDGLIYEHPQILDYCDIGDEEPMIIVRLGLENLAQYGFLMKIREDFYDFQPVYRARFKEASEEQRSS
jgi:hypothetical protein